MVLGMPASYFDFELLCLRDEEECMLYKLPCIGNMNTVRAICNPQYKYQSAGTEQRKLRLWSVLHRLLLL